MAASDHLSSQFGSTWSKKDYATARRVDQMMKLYDYHMARESDLRHQEDRTGGYAGDVAHEKATGVQQPMTYKRWLQGR